MISGPTIPNTLASLRDLLIQRVELIEHGLRVLSEDLVLGNDAGVDLLACDATGAPTLLFIAVPETSPQLPARLIGAASWLRHNSAFLAREIPDPHLRVDAQPRLLVVGLDIFADTLAELRRARLDRLTVLQLCSFTVGGRLRVGVTPLLESVSREDPGGWPEDDSTVVPSTLRGSPEDRSGASAGKSGLGSDTADSPLDPVRDGFVIPEGIVDPAQRALAARFLDLARRVDGRLTASGDRFSRRVYLHGRVLARLGLSSGTLVVEFPSGGDPVAADLAGQGGESADDHVDDLAVELNADGCLDVVDRLLRLVLANEIATGSAPPRENTFRESAVPAGVPSSDAVRPSPATTPDGTEEAPKSAGPTNPGGTDSTQEDRFSLEPIRRSVARAQLSREEFSALGEDGSDS